MKIPSNFYLLGLLVAGLEEFITQGVLKHTYGGWILPTLIAFLPFLVLARMIGWCLDRTLSEPGSILIYYLAAGSIGLLVEWFLIGLSPWRDLQAPMLAILLLQLGMFSFWGSVAFVPRLLLDQRCVAKARRSCQRFLICGMAAIYGLTFAAADKVRFPISIAAVLGTFLGLNVFYFQYIRAVGKLA